MGFKGAGSDFPPASYCSCRFPKRARMLHIDEFRAVAFHVPHDEPRLVRSTCSRPPSFRRAGFRVTTTSMYRANELRRHQGQAGHVSGRFTRASHSTIGTCKNLRGIWDACSPAFRDTDGWRGGKHRDDSGCRTLWILRVRVFSFAATTTRAITY